ncbi:TORTIFOLIA1-like protein 4 [Camellia lanceoleosa]|uniref:TORTIFOLIA1-like protein 4 n=1 Tax=Camellia lanceoleosa TaxID=1840588 RepID=A0ACC0F4Y6_9ERIC|nr:TORTIFOLIA1-like protein 4 [Camellia lanceoleosa]
MASVLVSNGDFSAAKSLVPSTSHVVSVYSKVQGRSWPPSSAIGDLDSSVCITAIASISSHLTKPLFTSIIKPFVESLVTKQDHNSQIRAALCLVVAIDATPDLDAMYLKKLLPKLKRLLKCDSFKVKLALLTLIESVIKSGAASSHQIMKNLVSCLVEFIGCDD